MSRDDGFRIADTDTGMMADPKVLALARRLRDSVRTAAAIASTMPCGWRHGTPDPGSPSRTPRRAGGSSRWTFTPGT